MTNRITKLTEQYLEKFLALLDDGEEVPKGMTIKEYVRADGTTTLRNVWINCDCDRGAK